MRRCGRASCLVLVGLFAAATAAGGAYPAAGGHQGKGHAWAKGKAKNQAATPQLSSSPATVHAKPHARVTKATATVTTVPKASSRGAVARHNHLTICHRTGSGYIVISPDVMGVMNGHFKRHDDFLYEDGCPGAPVAPRPQPNQGPQPGAKAPEEGSGVTPGVAAASSGDLPFTGLPAFGFILGGALLALAGLLLRFPAVRVGRNSLLSKPKSRT
jgi:hypothetical protein